MLTVEQVYAIVQRVPKWYEALVLIATFGSPPRSRAGRRVAGLPSEVIPVIRARLKNFVGPGSDALVFTTETGRPIWRGNFNKLVNWRALVTELGVPDLHFHDLRHTGNTWAADSGVSTRDLMARMGHSSVQAAMVYQHASAEAARRIADSMNARVKAARPKRPKGEGSSGRGKRHGSGEGSDGAAAPVA